MSKQASKTVIGIFVMGALALVVAGVLVFGSGRFFAETSTWVLYFDGSIKGLSVGAPVNFKGVRVGTVTDIKLLVDEKAVSFKIPVYIETESRRFTVVHSNTSILRSLSREEEQRRIAKTLIEKGLRGQLELDSLVTGKLLVALDFFPDTPVHLRGDGKTPEIPTIPSLSVQKLAKTLENIPLKELVDKLVKTVNGINDILASPKLKSVVATLDDTMKDIHKLVRDVDGHVEPLASSIGGAVRDYGKLARDVDGKVEPLLTSITSASDAARGAMLQAEKTLALEEGAPGELATSLKGALDEAKEAMVKAKEVLASADGVIAEGSPLRYELDNMLAELSSAARSIRVLADYLERHPEALIKGKGGSGGY